jgi:DNA-directed RNA polymerase subunit alpha
VLNALRSRGIDKVGQVLTMEKEQLMSIRNFGPSSFTELKDTLVQHGYMTEGDEEGTGEAGDEAAEAVLAIGGEDAGGGEGEE